MLKAIFGLSAIYIMIAVSSSRFNSQARNKGWRGSGQFYPPRNFQQHV